VIPNCNLKRQEILQTEDIFEHSIGLLKGRTTRQPAQQVGTTWEQVAKEIDIMGINKIHFMLMMLKDEQKYNHDVHMTSCIGISCQSFLSM